MRISAIINQKIPALKGMKGFHVEPTRTRIDAKLTYDGNGDINGAEAWPMKGLPEMTQRLYPIDGWTFSVDAGSFKRERDFRQEVIACTAEGKRIQAKGIPFTDTHKVWDEKTKAEVVKEVDLTSLVNIRDSVAEVTAMYGKGSYGRDLSEWYIDVYRFGKTNGTWVAIKKEVHKWYFPKSLITAAITGDIPNKERIIQSIIDNVMHICRDEAKQEIFIAMAEPMAVTCLRLFDRDATLSIPVTTPAPAPKLEAKATPAPEAPAPEAQATEEPATSPTADEPTPEVSYQETEGEVFEQPNLRAVPPLTDEQQATADQQVDPGRKGTGRTRNPKSTKKGKGKGAKTGTDGE